MMRLDLSEAERTRLEAAAAAERRVRVWRRYRALLLLAEGELGPEQVAAALGCARASVYGWVQAWRRQGVAGLQEAPRTGRPPRLAGAGTAALEQVLATDPQACGQHATGWTVPLLRSELAAAGYAVSARTVRRTLHRQGWRWKRPKYVLGRPDPAYAEKRGPSLPKLRRC
jgi:transposase